MIDAEGLRQLERRHDGASFARRRFCRGDISVGGKWSCWVGWIIEREGEGRRWNESSLGYFRCFARFAGCPLTWKGRSVVRGFGGYRDDANVQVRKFEESRDSMSLELIHRCKVCLLRGWSDDCI